MGGPSQTDADARYMRAAISLSRRGLGATGSNPSVGCVIAAADGRILGRGVTAAGGRPHAEARALAEARDIWGEAAERLLRGATAYVTLEPCAHFGATPPCAHALIEAKVGRVVVALQDPDPRVSGRGIGNMRVAGVEVVVGVLADEAAEVLGGYLLNRQSGRPRLTLKLAATLDGRIATASGESQWISCPTALKRAHAIRAASDVVLVGAGTAQIDDPALNVRLPGLEASSPARAVADSLLRTPLDGQLMNSARERRLYLFHASDAPQERRKACADAGAELIEVARMADGRLDISEIFQNLGSRGHIEAMCEGGGKLAAALLKADLVDRLICVHAGIAIGADGRAAIGELGLQRLADAPALELAALERIGDDALSEWRRSK